MFFRVIFIENKIIAFINTAKAVVTNNVKFLISNLPKIR